MSTPPFSAPPFQLGKIGHVGMHVKDLERSARFYTEILGFQVSDYHTDSVTQ